MRRIQLFEIEDQLWCPRAVRNAITDFLQFGLTLLNFYEPIYQLLQQAIFASNAQAILDLGSGGGGPWPNLRRIFEKTDFPIFLSDKYPNLDAFRRIADRSSGKVNYHQEPVDALAIPSSLDGFRTIFSGFHHYRPDDARAILQRAVDREQGIGIFELTGRHPLSFLLAFAMPVFALLTCPFIRPFRFSRLFWTYIIPAAPIAGFLDGIVSCFRTYSIEEMKELITSLPKNDYSWIVGKKKTKFLGTPILYLIGYPINEG